MKSLSPLVPLLVFALSAGLAQDRPIRTRKGDLYDQMPVPHEPLPHLRIRLDPVQLNHDAHQLAQLAESIPSDIDQLNKGMLPKDLKDKLKQIEKLSKHLRGEIP